MREGLNDQEESLETGGGEVGIQAAGACEPIRRTSLLAQRQQGITKKKRRCCVASSRCTVREQSRRSRADNKRGTSTGNCGGLHKLG